MYGRVGSCRSRVALALSISITGFLTGSVGGCGGESEPSETTGLTNQGTPQQTTTPTTAAPGAAGTKATPSGGSSGARATSSATMPIGVSSAGQGPIGSAGVSAQQQPPAAGVAGMSMAVSAAGAMAGAAGMAAAGAGAAAAGSTGSMMLPNGANNFVSVCEGGKVGMDSEAAKSSLRKLDIMREYAGVKMLIKSPNAVLSFKTTLQVPKTPTQRQTLFIWPGLQSRDGAADPGRVGNGVLQPVLTWGGSCAPKAPSDPYSGWWIAGMYVTLSSNVAGPSGCGGGDYLSTSLGDLLEIDMFEKDMKWVTTIRNVMMNKTVDYTVDLKGQVQNEVMWLIEVPDGSSIRPVDDTIWTQNVLTFKDPVTSCQPDRMGSADSFSAPILSKDGLHCCWDKIVLRANRM